MDFTKAFCRRLDLNGRARLSVRRAGRDARRRDGGAAMFVDRIDTNTLWWYVLGKYSGQSWVKLVVNIWRDSAWEFVEIHRAQSIFPSTV